MVCTINLSDLINWPDSICSSPSGLWSSDLTWFKWFWIKWFDKITPFKSRIKTWAMTDLILVVLEQSDLTWFKGFQVKWFERPESSGHGWSSLTWFKRSRIKWFDKPDSSGPGSIPWSFNLTTITYESCVSLSNSMFVVISPDIWSNVNTAKINKNIWTQKWYVCKFDNLVNASKCKKNKSKKKTLI